MVGVAESGFQRWLTFGSILVLLLTSAFHFYRGAPADGGVYLLVAAVLILNAKKERLDTEARPGNVSGRPFHRWWLIVVLPLLATVVAFLPIGPWLVIVLLGIGGGIMLLGWRLAPKSGAVVNPRTSSPQLRNTALGMGAVVLFLCFWELWMYFTEHLNPAMESTYPPLTDLVEPAFQSTGTRWLLTLLWMTGCLLMIVPHPGSNGRKRS